MSNTKKPIDDGERAASNPFGVSLNQLVDIVEGYRQRRYNEDMQVIESLGGT
jgi:hypothetical protein